MKKTILKILDYLEEDEYKHFLESEKPKDHIYLDVIRARVWLESPSCPLVDEKEVEP